MKKLLKILLVFVIINCSTLNIVACNNIQYYDDRTSVQLADDSYLMNTNLTLNSKKYVLLIGLDGIPYNDLPPTLITNSQFKVSYHIQNYETIKGWSSVLWGNVVEHKKDVFSLIKQNSSLLTTANITQWMGKYYHSSIYESTTDKNIDFEKDFSNQSSSDNYDTIVKIRECFNDLLVATNSVIVQNYNFTFMYNAFFDQLKHEKHLNKEPLVKFLLAKYEKVIENFYTTLDKNEWLIITTTDHGRNTDSFNHDNNDINAHFSWTLANNDLNSILGHNYNNFYDIRTCVLKWLSQ